MSKKIVFICFIAALVFSCKQEDKKVVTEIENSELGPITDAILETATIYEANIRQYSVEGSFNAFTKDIPGLRELGVDIIWVMPIYPISNTKSKGSLGSYYAISDYTKVNPEFGTLEDFRNLVETAHDNGIYVILDWVANHTGWDHVWITEHPEYYTKDSNGNITDPLNPETGESWGWTDVADLNYENQEMRAEMIENMKYWITEEGVDGFRCDVAFTVPTDFWNTAATELRKEKPVFMLAEAETPELLVDIFDMQYGWEAMHLMNGLAKGEKKVADFDHYMATRDSLLQEDDMYMYFTTNHDENSWNGTVFERYGDHAETFSALTYMLPGMPLIYSGQEYDLDKRLLFFEKDTIRKVKGEFYPFFQKMNALKATNKALNGGKKAAAYKRIETSDDTNVLAFERNKENDKVIFAANFSDKTSTITMKYTGIFQDYMSGTTIELKEGVEYEFEPWEYIILVEE